MIRRFPRLPIRRFPRLPAIDGKEFSMDKVWETLYRIMQGRPVKTKNERLACRWFGVKVMTKKEARRFYKAGGGYGKTS